MIKTLKTGLCILGMLVLSAQSFSQISLIPKPAQITFQSAGDSFAITPKTILVIGQASLQPSADFINNYVKEI